MASSIPPCFVFKPTDQQLITVYLRPKAMGSSLPFNRILYRNLYEKTPWNVFSNDDPWEIVGDSEVDVSKKEIYVFTKLEKIGSRHIVRMAGCGRWDGKCSPKVIKDCRGKVIGVKKSFTFKMNGDLKQGEINMKKGRWIMHEYTLAGSSLKEVNNTDYAICRILWDQEDTDLVVHSGFGKVEDTDEYQKRKSSFERPTEKWVCIEKDLDDKELNFGAATSCHGTWSDMSDEDFSNWLDQMISYDDIETTEKRVCMEKDLDDKKLNFGAATSCHGTWSDMSDEDFSNWLDQMISYDDFESTEKRVCMEKDLDDMTHEEFSNLVNQAISFGHNG